MPETRSRGTRTGHLVPPSKWGLEGGGGNKHVMTRFVLGLREEKERTGSCYMIDQLCSSGFG